MTVLLTGGAGYIGSHVAVELLQLGYDVIIADNFYNSSQEVPERIRKITGESVRTYNVDIQNSADLEQIFKQHEINAVMHFAGYKAVGESVQQPLKYYRGNTLNARSEFDNSVAALKEDQREALAAFIKTMV